MVDRWSLASAVTMVVALGVSAGVLVSEWTVPAMSAPDATTVVEPEAVSRNIVCSGSVLAVVDDSSSWARIGTVTEHITGGNRVAQLVTDTEPDGAIVTFDESPDSVAATESAVLDNELVAGYLAAECGDPANSQWLVGGSTTTGRDAVLTIGNGSGVDARIDLEFWGASGPIVAPAASGIVIPAGSSKSFSLAGFIPGEPSPAVHVVSSGAPVWSTLQVTTTRGLTPGGLDRIAPTTEPATEVVIPVVRQPDGETVGPLRVDPDYTDTVTVVRVFTPGESDGTASITLLPLSGGESVTIETPVTAGTVTDIAIDELASGDFSLIVEADVPVLASARFTAYNTETEIVDSAWSPAVVGRAGKSMAYVPVSNSTLVLTNPTDQPVIVTVSTAGNESDLEVAPRSSRSVTVSRGALIVSSDGTVAAGVVMTVPEGIATLRLPTEPLGARSVTVIAH